MLDADEPLGKPGLDERDMIGQAAGAGIVEEVHNGLLVVTHLRFSAWR
jgi:hypothetical protein